jgi:hypothetical protein
MIDSEFAWDDRQHGGLDDEGEDHDNPGFLRFYQPPGIECFGTGEDDDE